MNGAGTSRGAPGEPMANHVFGCDICQDVCPWNRRAPIATIPHFKRRVFPQPGGNLTSRSLPPQDESLYRPGLEWLLGLSEAEFRELFRGSPVKRAKWRGLIRNACIALGNSGLRPGTADHHRISDRLERLAASGGQNLAEYARGGLSPIQMKGKGKDAEGPQHGELRRQRVRAW